MFNNNNIMWLVLTFSHNKLIPDENEVFNCGVAGLRHIQYGYLCILPLIAEKLNRKAVLPPPWLALEARHNNSKMVDKNRLWTDFYGMTSIKNIDLNPPLSFENSGRILTNKTIKYYEGDTSINDLINNNDDTEIIVLSNFYNSEKKRHCFDKLNYNPSHSNENIKLNSSILIRGIVDNIIDNIIKKKEYTFIHIRRGDFLDNSVLSRFGGTRVYTEPVFINKVLLEKSKENNIIIISTNETDLNYKRELNKLLSPTKRLFFEETFIQQLSDDIKNDNYMIYSIMNEIANRAKINIVSCSIKLGNKVDCSLENEYRKDILLQKNINNKNNNISGRTWKIFTFK